MKYLVLVACLVSGCGGGDGSPINDAPVSVRFVQQPSMAEQGAMLSPAVAVALVDADGNIATGAVGLVHIELGANPGSAALAGGTDVAVVDGVATFDDLAISEVGQGYTLVGSSSVVGTSVTSDAFDVVLGGPSVAQSTLVATPQTVDADGIASVTVTTTVRTLAGVPLPGQQVSLQVTGNENHIIPAIGITDAQGTWSAQVASTVAGTKTITATTGSVTLSADVTFAAIPCTLALPGIPINIQTDSIRSLFVGDFDGDGRSDLAVLEDTQLAIRLGVGNGALRNAVRYPVGSIPLGSNPRAVTGGDIDGDGRVDLVVADSASTSLRVFLGHGDGTFTAGQPIVTSSSPYLVELVDLDGDAVLDVVLRTELEVVVLHGQGSGTFTPVASYPLGISISNFPTMALADMNADGHLDVVTGGSYGFISVLLGNSNGTFQSPIRTTSTTSSGSIAVADYDGDAKRDVVVTDTYGAYLMHGNGDGTFGAVTSVTNGYPARTALAHDFDGDGKQDLLVAGAGLWILRSNGNGTFASPRMYALDDYSTALVLGDFNGDGRTDVATGNGLSSATTFALSIVLGGSGLTLLAPTYDPGALNVSTFSAVAADFDGNGTLDLLARNSFSSEIGVQLAAPNGTLTAVPTMFVQGSIQTIGDFDGDTKLDLLVANGTSVRWLRGTGTGTFLAPVDSIVGAYAGPVVAAKLNGGNVLDLAIVDGLANTVSVALGNGNGTFATAVSYAVGNGPRDVVASDLDSDGDVDLVVSNNTGVSVSILLNNGSGVFTLGSTIANVSFGGSQGSLAAGDLDGDGKVDLAISAYHQQISIYYGNGNGTFQPVVRIDAAIDTSAIKAIDLDLDGNLDLVALGRGTIVLRGNGDGTFLPAKVYDSGRGNDFVAADFDGDGRLDFLVPGFDGSYGVVRSSNVACQ